jgi:hypothetical protein
MSSFEVVEPEVIEPVRLTAHAEDENTRIEVLDGNLNVVPGSSRLGQTTVEVPPGAYAVRFQIGTDYVQRIAILAPNSGETHVWLRDEDAPKFATAAPVERTRSTREKHREPAERISRSEPLAKGEGAPEYSHLLIFARDLVKPGTSDPAQGLTLHDMNGAMIADFSADAERDLSERWAGIHYALPPEAYRLRLSAGSRAFTEQIVYLTKGWQTQVFLLVRGTGGSGENQRVSLESASVLMARPDGGFNPERQDLRWTESALRALSGSGNIPGSVRTEMLWDKFQNPMLGIYAGLLHLRRQEIIPDLLRQVFHNLMALVGPLPDVLAIGWGLALRDAKTRGDALFMQTLNRPGDLATPPMLRASWELLVEASVLHKEIIPAGTFCERTSTRLTAAGPWYAWRGDPGAAPVEPEPEPSLDLGWLGSFIPAGFVRGLAIGTLTIALPIVAKMLAATPMAGRLLYSRRFTDAERRVAQYVYPLVDLHLQALVEGDEALIAEVLEGMKSRGTDAVALVKSLKIPASAALVAAWGLMRKLALQPVVPNDMWLDAFATEESHQNHILKTALRRLKTEPATLRHKRGGDPVNVLAIVFLRYRGSPAASDDDPRSAAATARVLEDNEYVMSQSGDGVSAELLDAAVADARSRLLSWLQERVAKHKIAFAEGWQSKVLPPPDTYSRGFLLPAPSNEEVARASANPRGAARRPSKRGPRSRSKKRRTP